LIKRLTEEKKKVFLLAFTHSALDSLLKKLKILNINFIRITSTPNKVQKEIRPFILENLIEEKKLYNVDSFSKFVNSIDVWATTPFSLHHPALFRKFFNYCIIDEASQMTLPVKI
jgi:DNA replication ATP-dependent helicase Dna2